MLFKEYINKSLEEISSFVEVRAIKDDLNEALSDYALTQTRFGIKHLNKFETMPNEITNFEETFDVLISYLKNSEFKKRLDYCLKDFIENIFENFYCQFHQLKHKKDQEYKLQEEKRLKERKQKEYYSNNSTSCRSTHNSINEPPRPDGRKSIIDFLEENRRWNNEHNLKNDWWF